MDISSDDHLEDDLDQRKADFLEAGIDDVEEEEDPNDPFVKDGEESEATAGFESETLAYMGDPYEEGRYSY